MKLKKFLAIVISLAMVLSVVPSFSLTVGAADYTSSDLVAFATANGYVFDGSASNGIVNNGGSDIKLGSITTPEHWVGWSSSWDNIGYNVTDGTATNVNVCSNSDVNYIQFYAKKVTKLSCAGTVTTSSAVQSGTAKRDFVVLEFGIDGPGSSEYDFGIYNNDGELVDSFRHLSNRIGAFYADDMGGGNAYGSNQLFNTLKYTTDAGAWAGETAADNKKIRIAYTNNYDDSGNATGYIASYYYSSDGNTYTYKLNKVFATGSVNGIKEIKGYHSWQNDDSNYTGVQLRDIKIYAGDYPSASTEATVKGALDSLVIDNSTNGENITLPTTASDIGGTHNVTWSSSDEAILTSAGVYTYTGTSITAVTLTPTADFGGTTVTGNAKTVMVFPKSRAGEYYFSDSKTYEVGAENLIEAAGTAASFEDKNGNFCLDGWMGDTNADFTDVDTKIVSGDNNYWYAITSDKAYNASATITLDTYIPDGKWSLGSRWPDGTNGLCTLNTAWKVEANKTYYLSFYAKAKSNLAGAQDIYAYFATERSNGSVPTAWSTIVEAKQVTTTTDWKKYEYIFDTTQAGYIGFYAANLCVSGDWENVPKNYFDDFELYTLTEVEETLTTVDTLYTSVVSGNKPVLPNTVTGTGSLGSTGITESVTWNTSDVDFTNTGSSATTVTVKGATADSNLETTAVITVYPQSWGLADMESVVEASGRHNIKNSVTLPVAVTGDAVFEFDLVQNAIRTDQVIGFADADNLVSSLWGGAQQIQLGNGNIDGTIKFRANGSTAYGLGNQDVVITAGTYRVLIKTNVSSSKYDIVMTKEDGTVVLNAEGLGYRSAAKGALDTLLFLSNGGNDANGAGALNGDMEIKNFKAYTPDVAGNLEEYTIVFSGVNRANETVYADKTIVNALPTNSYIPGYEIPHIDGYVFTDYSLSGTTYTLKYAANTDSIGTWFTRHNIQSPDMKIADMNMLGAHDAFTYKMTKTYDPAACLQKDSGSMTLAMYNNGVGFAQTQDSSAATLLAKGVRYFDVRLTMSDASESSVPYGATGALKKTMTGTNGEWYTTHGYIATPFRTVLYQIRDFCEENPGEVILLDFQNVYDSVNNADGGTDNVLTYRDLGADIRYILDGYLVAGSETADTITWKSATNNGNRAAVICVGKDGAADNDGALFVRGGDRNADNKSKSSSIYSYYTKTYTTEGEMLSGIATQYENAANVPNTRFMVMQAIFGELTDGLMSNGTTVGKNLISNSNFNTWIKTLKIVMMDNADDNAEAYCNLFAKYNRDTYSVTYNQTTNGVTMTTAEGAGANVPYSAAFIADSKTATGSYTVTYDNRTFEATAVTAYDIATSQYDGTYSYELGGNVTVTFPRLSDGVKTVDVLLSDDGKTVYAVAGLGESVSITTNALAKVILATAPAPGLNLTVQYVAGDTVVKEYNDYYAYGGAELYNVEKGDFYITYNGKAYIVKSEEAQSYTLQEADNYTDGGTVKVPLTMVSEYAVLTDALVSGDELWGVDSANDNHVYVSAGNDKNRGAIVDADDASVVETVPSLSDKSRIGLFEFPVVALNSGESAIARFPIFDWKGNYAFTNGNTSIRFEVIAVNDSSWTTVTKDGAHDGAVYTVADAPVFEGYTTSVFSNAVTATSDYIEFDVTELMNAASSANLNTITLKMVAGYGEVRIDDSERAVYGGENAGQAAHISVVTGSNTVSVAGATKVTKNGSDVTAYATDAIVVPADETIKIYTPNPYVTDDTNVYAVEDGVVDIQVTDKAEYRAAKLGIGMVEGAQVRIGGGVDGEGRVSAGSGLRFITTVDGADSLAAIEGAKFGVKITAENSTNVVDIPAAQWQDEAKTVFTSALTDLAVSNYNRKFTATPYVEIGGTRYYGTPVTRSIYQVAAGLLAKGYDGSYGESADKTGTTYEMSDVLIDVLNAYVNQVGIRLTFTDTDGSTTYTDGDTLTVRTEGTGAYTGEAFFKVGETTYDNGVYTVTLTPVGNNTVIKLNNVSSDKNADGVAYYQEYVRINNNNSAVYAAVEVVYDEESKTYTLTFDTNQLNK